MIEFELNTQIYRALAQVFSFVALPENDFQYKENLAMLKSVLEAHQIWNPESTQYEWRYA